MATIEHSGVAWFAVIWIGFLILLNSLIVATIFFKTGRYLEASQSRLEALGARVGAAATGLRHMLAHLERMPELLSKAEGRTPNLLEPISRAIQALDQSAASTTARLRQRLARLDEATDTVLSNLSTETFRVHRAIIHPAMRLSGMLQSVTSMFEKYVQREKPPAAYSSDEEIFI